VLEAARKSCMPQSSKEKERASGQRGPDMWEADIRMWGKLQQMECIGPGGFVSGVAGLRVLGASPPTAPCHGVLGG